MPERAFLVSVACNNSGEQWSASESLDELAQLASTAGAEVIGRLIQRLHKSSKLTYLGKGKLEELLALKGSSCYNLVIFDDELSPIQQQNLEETLKVKIIDRVALILDIFARHAHTREGKLQVELAQHQYLLPRLAGQWSHLERLGGGIGTRGPGESQLETDRRLIRQKIGRLKAQLAEVRKHRMLYRQQRRRSGIPVVAIVGYTNTGKSTLFNSLSQAGVVVEDKLFATLDPITRRLTLPDKSTFLLSDTVGFIRKLPPTVVSAFRATLEELTEADVLLHVLDFSSHNAAQQCQIVEDILGDLNLQGKLRVTALNKVDLLLGNNKKWSEEEAMDFLAPKTGGECENMVLISATKGWGLKNLLEILNRAINQTRRPVFQKTSQNDAL